MPASDAQTVRGKAVPAVEECWAQVEGVRMRYLRTGTGPALVLLHGLLGYSFSWRFTLPALAPHRTVYAVDMPGAGFSQRSSALPVTFRASAHRLLRFAGQAGLSSFDLLGTSHGGAVAMMAAALAGENEPRVRRLVLAAPVNPWSQHGKRLSRLLSHPLIAYLFPRLFPRLTPVHGMLLRRLYGDTRRIPPGTLAGYSEPYRIPGGFEYSLRILKTWNDDLRDLESVLPAIAHIPTLILWGTRDAAVDPATAEILRQRFRHCHVKTFPGAGHLPYEEVAGEFNAALVEFLLGE